MKDYVGGFVLKIDFYLYSETTSDILAQYVLEE